MATWRSQARREEAPAPGASHPAAGCCALAERRPVSHGRLDRLLKGFKGDLGPHKALIGLCGL